MSGVKHKVFKWKQPNALALATTLHERCANNVRRWVSDSPGAFAKVTDVQRHSGAGKVMFIIEGRTAADTQHWKSAWTDYYGRENMEEQLTRQQTRGAIGTRGGVLMMHGKQYGFTLRVELDITMPTLDVDVYADGVVPATILRCVKSTYNELVEQYGEPA